MKHSDLNRRGFVAAPLVAAIFKAERAASIFVRAPAIVRSIKVGAVSTTLATMCTFPSRSEAHPVLLFASFMAWIGYDHSKRTKLENPTAWQARSQQAGDNFHEATQSPIVVAPSQRSGESAVAGGFLKTINGDIQLRQSGGEWGDINAWEASLFTRWKVPPGQPSTLRSQGSPAIREVIADAWSRMGVPIHRSQVEQFREWKSTEQRVISAFSKPLENGQVMGVLINANTGTVVPIKQG